LKRKLFFHGYLKNLVPDGVELSGNTVTEILNGLAKQVKALQPSLKGGKHVIQVAGFSSVESLVKPLTDDVTELHLVPAMQGGKGGFFRIVIGAIILTAAVLAAPATGGSSLLAAFNAAGWVSAAAIFGTTLILGGLLELVSPAPKMDLDGNDASKYLGASTNTTKIGTRIPLMYGENMWHGHILSFNVSSGLTNPNPSSDYISWNPYESP
jgi:predicted phage tail protein